ncbi:MAG: endonuclease [Bacteroidales bacterium]
MCRKGLVLIITFFSFVVFQALGQPTQKKQKVFLFWNVENYFDPFNDPKTADEDFSLGGKNYWNWKKFEKKRNAIAKVILSAADKYECFPIIVGLAEIENRMVLNQIINETALSRLEYSIIHKNSPDKRGIDVALLYSNKDFKPLSTEFLQVTLPDSSSTRDILYVKGLLQNSPSLADTIHIFVNHWPSKLGGEKKSLSKRMAAAKTLKTKVDSIFNLSVNTYSYSVCPFSEQVTYNTPKIIIMGDFNDIPDSNPLIYLCDTLLTNLALPLFSEGKGTIKYKGEWEMIDQIIISKSLVTNSEFSIFSPENLLEKDKTYLGKKPFRTFIGPRYNGGISDHLPVVLILH